MKAIDDKDNLRLQANRHELVRYRGFRSREDYLLFLLHKKPYEDASNPSIGKDVLDFGCNDGYGTHLISQKCKKIIGVDVSPKAILTARKHFQKNNIEFLEIDGKSLPFPNGSFDLITCFQVIEHILDTNQLLVEISRVLKPGGRVAFTTPNAKIRIPEGMKPWNRFHVREYAASEFKSLLENHFSKVSLEGMFARPPLHNIELGRIRRAISASKTAEKNDKNLDFFRHRVPPFLKKALRYLRFVIKDRNELIAFFNLYSTSDLFYLSENIDDSLDLKATCTF